MKKIQIRGHNPNNLQAKVDDDFFDYINSHKWYLNKGYAIRVMAKRDGGKIIKMHREVMGVLGTKALIDHIDRDRLNNQKSNLRICTQSENSINCTPRYSNNTSGTKGVYWHKNRRKWQVFVVRNKKIIYLGTYKNKNDAIKARRTFIG